MDQDCSLCDVRYAGIHHRQYQRAIEVIDETLLKMLDADPEMHYVGDFNELLDRRLALDCALRNGAEAYTSDVPQWGQPLSDPLQREGLARTWSAARQAWQVWSPPE